ncbi:hypothetical protein [Deinococcus petrolearius]|uniref:Uncharacterized protein n=1 Tax=Deinococcus petrolearius TaxID=1751295 RepID=A0ABW1DNB3_9DEIO
MKALELVAREWVNVEEGVFPGLYVANLRAYAASYREPQPPGEALTSEYAQAQPAPITSSGPELLEALHRLTYNIVSNDGRSWLTAEGEAMRRRLVQSVAFELLTEGGPWVQVADSGSIRRVNFDLYEISSRNPAEGARARPYLIDGRPHRHEGFVTDRPWEAFAALWEMNDECHTHWLEGHGRDLRAQAKRLGIL